MRPRCQQLVAILFTLSVVCITAQRRNRDIRGQIRGNITGDTYSPNFNDITPGASSLAFVFDVTGSMWDDLKQVIAGARQIVETTLSRSEKPLYNYVLIPFHDPVVGPTIVTSNPTTFQQSLRDLYVQGGGDCPEMSITAIREALLISLPGSFIYVFTDARSKDFFQLPEVLQIIQRKQSQVVFVLTGKCEDDDHEGYQAYEKIAATSSGQVFLITKDDVSEVVKFIEVSVQAHKVVLLAADHDAPGVHEWSIPFDPELQEITISVSGPGRRLTLMDPDGTIITPQYGLETLLNLEKVLIVNLKEPQPGLWRLIVDSTGEHTLRVTGLSILDFQARFSRQPTFNWLQTEFQPVAGINTYVLLNATGLPHPGNFQFLDILDIAGRNIQTIELSTPRDPNQPYLYTVDPFIPPNQPFHMAVRGQTEDEFPFIRATKNAVINIVPVSPVVQMPETHPGYFDYPAEIPCQITSLLPFHVTWSREVQGHWLQLLPQPRHYLDSVTDYYRIEEVTEAAEGNYRCYANNSEGYGHGQTFLDVEERPPVITVNGNVTVVPGTNAILTCDVISNVEFTLRWEKADGSRLERRRFRKLRNGSLLIRNAKPRDEAMYQCTAVNIGGETAEIIGLIVERPPRVTIKPPRKTAFSSGDTIRIDCSATGLPDPTIEWLKGSTYLLDIGKIRIGRRGKYLEIVNAASVDEGVYTCQGSNRAGTDQASVEWYFTETPTVTVPESHLLVLEGTRVTLICDVTGTPKPAVRWHKGGTQIVTSRSYEILENGHLVILQAARSDSDVFRCTASNVAGRATGRITLEVGWLPVITHPPLDIGIDIGHNVTFECAADGNPEPEITWFRGATRDHAERGLLDVNPRAWLQNETDSLSISFLTLDDGGAYTCTATNTFGSTVSTAQLSITGTALPRVDVGPSRIHVIEGDSITIPCRILSGNPYPTRQWHKGRVELGSTDRVWVNVHGNVAINQAVPDDAGSYICTATNVIGVDRRRVRLDVWVPPEIVRGESSFTTIEHDPITIPCISVGNPIPEVVWKRRGVGIALNNQLGYQVAGDGSLTISAPVPQDSGVYTCTARNDAGSDHIDVSLDVYLIPQVGSDSPDVYVVTQGDSITLECGVTRSDPPPTYEWFKDEQPLTGNEFGVSISANGNLTFFSAVVSDAGDYTCVATNIAGSIDRSMQLIVQVPPSIRRGPALIKVLVGETAGLNCYATGLPTPTLRWFRGEVEITTDLNERYVVNADAGFSNLQIRDARLTDDDEYLCVARNPAGRDSSSVFVDVQSVPSIRKNNNCVPKEENGYCVANPIELGQLSLACNATGDPRPVIRWYHDGEEIDELDPNVNIGDDGTLTLQSVTSSDNGEYICEAENDRGIVRQVNRVLVHERPEIDGGGEDIERIWIRVGEDVDLTCEANAVPPPLITWYGGDQQQIPVQEELNHIQFVSSGSIFRITNARVSDTGMYKCLAVNLVGRTQKFIRLDVYVPPSIRDNSDVSRHVVVIDQSVELHCNVDGIPFPSIQWFKGTTRLAVDDERLQIDNRGQTLRINSAVVTDTASYKCIANNIAGEDSKDFYLDVHVPPTINGNDLTHTVTLNDHLALSCFARGIPTPTVRWTHNGQTLTSRPGARLVQDGQVVELASAQVSDEGEYRCVAWNVAGEENRTHVVNVQVPPTIAGDSTIYNSTVTLGGTVTLTCHASGDPPPTIVWLKNETPIFGSGGNVEISADGTELTISDARESDRGTYACVASNDVGVETQYHNLDVLVPPVIANPNEHVIAVEHETTTLQCNVYAHPFADIRWEVFGARVLGSSRFTFSERNQILTITDVAVGDATEYTCIASNVVGRATKLTTLVVHVPATLIYPTENSIEHTVIEDERYELRCVANGIPLPTITWMKDGVPLVDTKTLKIRDNGRVLAITKADPIAHEGSYECVAVNLNGEDNRIMSLVVYVPPLIIGHTKVHNKVINVGRSEVLECRIKKGKPTPEIKWYNRDNQLIDAAPGLVFTDGKQRLHILSARLSDVGNYWCEATNIAGKSRKDFSLEVIVPPTIRGEGEITRVSVILDNDVTMECQVEGIPTPDVTWLKDGVPLVAVRTGEYSLSAGGTRLNVIRAQESEAGTYTCVAQNDAGNSSKDFLLDIYLPPSIGSDEVENITVVENTPVTMMCDIDAFPPPTITWYKDSRPLLLKPGLRLSHNDRQLDISWTQEDDAGLYHCDATNVAGRQKKYFKLTVHVVPTIAGQPYNILNHVVGDRIHMVCEPDGIPLPVIVWKKDDRVLPSDATIKGEGRVLDIYSAKVSHSGLFVCNSTNVAGYDVKTYKVTVYEPPSIADNDDDIIVVVNRGDLMTLECDVTGIPPPEIVWLKNRRPLSKYFDKAQVRENGRFLVVEDADVEDAGRYTCSARNQVGEDKKNFQVDVNVPPSIRDNDEPENRWVAQGNNISLTCDAEAIPVPTIRWLVNGEPLTPTPRVRPRSGGRTLFISNAKDGDAARYTCVATNAAGSTSRDIDLDVYSQPSIEGSDVPDRHDVNRGSAFTVTCDVGGFPAPDIEWQKDGYRIATSLNGVLGGSSEYTLTDGGKYLMVASAELRHAGDYMCRAINEAGEDSKLHKVNVREPPTISDRESSPTDVTTHVNTPTLLRCSAYGVPSPTIHWLKDGVRLDVENSTTMSTQFGGRYLRIHNTLLDDEGAFTCVASNEAGDATKSFNLHVNVPPVIEGSDQRTPTPTGVPINDTIQLRCVIIEGNPFPQIRWWKGRRQLESGSRIQISSRGQMIEIHDSRMSDTSRYRCTANNVAGDDSKSFDVEVQVSPNFNDGDGTDMVDVNEGSPLHLHCKIHAVPAPQLTWYKDGRPLTPDDSDVYIFPDGRTLQIISAKPSDAGVYTCVATNPIGSDDKQTRVSVNVAPTIGDGSNIPENVEPNIGNPFTLSCPATGNPEPVITWYRNGVALNLTWDKYEAEDGAKLLTVRDSDLSDSGHYECRAKNKAGRDSKIFRVNVRIPPSINGPEFERRIALQNSAVVLLCDARGTPGPTLEWLKDGIPITQTGLSHSLVAEGRLLILMRIQTLNNGDYTCVATNAVGEASKTYEVTTHIAPVLPDTVGKITVNKGDVARISCEVEAVPLPTVQWTKNGVPVVPQLDGKVQLTADDQVLIVNDADESDVGSYMCVVSNPAGIKSRNFQVSVNVPPNIYGPAVIDRTANQGSSLTLICDVYAVPPATITWMKDGALLRTDHRVTLRSEGATLQIGTTEQSDTGVYVCHASNIVGEANQATNLRINVPPAIVTSPRNVDVIEGESTQLECLVSGIPLPTLQWFKSGTIVTSETHSNLVVSGNGETLMIHNAQVSDGVEYVCEASNVAGTETGNFFVRVLVRPTLRDGITDTPHIEILAGEQTTLECPVEGGYPTPEIRWMKNFQPVQLSDRIQMVAGGRHLRILNAHETDTATYSCTALNQAGSVSSSFLLDVYVPPMFLSPESEEITVFVGQRATLDCSVIGIPTPGVAWSKDEAPLRDLTEDPRSRVRSLLNSQKILVTEARVEDTGLYTCMATSIAGNEDKDFDFKVYDRTRIVGSETTERISVNVGERINLICDATAVPIPVVTWTKDDQPLVDSTRIKDDGGRMFVAGAQLSDGGTYTCVATSPAGTVEKDFDVTVNLPPSIDSGDRNVTAVVGDDVTLECRSDAVPPPTWRWMKNGRQINNAGRSLRLINVQVSETGVYTCIASNIAGTTSQDISLSVYEPPTIDVGPTDITATLGDTVKLPCVARGVPLPKVSWRKDSALISRNNTPGRFDFQGPGSLLVESVQVEDAGRYVCLVSNGAGSARRIIELDIEVPPSILPGSTNVTVTVNNPVTLDCEVTGLPRPTVIWTKNGQQFDVQGDPSVSLLGSGSLRIASAAVADTGYYRCVVTNPAGNTYRDVTLFVQVPPAIADAPTEYVKQPRNYLRIPCDVTGTPQPDVTWQKDGQDIDNLDDIYMDSAHGLVFTSVTLNHDSSYTCTAVNFAGSASYDVDVEVRLSPSIRAVRTNWTVFEGDTVTLPCDVSGVPTPTVTWRKGARVIERLDDRFVYLNDNSLLISLAQPSDAGTYTCVAQNVADVAFSDLLLDVYTAPKFEAEIPETKIVNVGESLVVPVSILGHPSPDIVWSRNGVDLQTVDGALQIAVVSLADEGLYSVTARNLAGLVTRYFRLVVQSPPVIVATRDTYVEIDQGEQISLPVSVEGKPRPVVAWTKDGQEINADGLRIQKSGLGTLVIHTSRSLDSGHYIATARNDAGRSSVEFQVLVRIPPVITDRPRDTELHAGDRLQLECSARGIPTPVITWRFKGQEIPGESLSDGHSRLVIENVQPLDAGRYYCEARNPAGVRNAIAFVRVQSPPVMDGEQDPVQVDKLGGNSMLDCPVRADPRPVITWMKNGQEVELNDRIRQLANGSLIIYNTIMVDAGDYSCFAFNDAGQVEVDVKLVLEMPPIIIVEPQNTVVDAGNSILMDCQAIGEPQPEIVWTKAGHALPPRASVLRNTSLLIHTARLEDTAEYECIATNFMGSSYSHALVTVRVHGGFGEWGMWGSCGTTCGYGEQERQRPCNNPPPANGGRSCDGSSSETRECGQGPCPVNGNWGSWYEWEECSVTCGQGMRSRSRECNNPPPSHGGFPCNGDVSERMICVNQRCSVDGGWSLWGPWMPCSSTCGEAEQMRLRHCNNPPPFGGGRKCFGSETSSRMCNVRSCPVNGGWSSWGNWEFCSVSCGGGERARTRACSEPFPSPGGEPCSGSNRQLDNCNIDACSVNGNWANWGLWSTCSRSCGGGQANRYRSCSNPAPKFGGRFCMGSDSDIRPCGLRSCPVDGNWALWGDWTECSKTCGSGVRSRRRYCTNPPPSNRGRWCSGDSSQVDVCKLAQCKGGPRHGEGILFGNINGIPFGGSDISANGTDIGDDLTRIQATIKNIPPSVGPYLKSQISILTPIYWTMARETEGAYNGYTLTEGIFDRDVMVEFASGEVVKMRHSAHGLDSEGKLKMEVTMDGYVPETNPFTHIDIKDYTEDYVQTGDGSLYAYSDRLLAMDGYIMPYTWNHSISYNASRGRMPYLVEQLSASDIIVDYDIDAEELFFQMDVRIGRGDPSDRCPDGFVLHSSGGYCTDEDECRTQHPCSHICINVVGSYICSCPSGYSIGPDGRTCEDIDECFTGEYICDPTLECVNTLGSYRCDVICEAGLRKTSNGRICEDIDECNEPGERICNHVCHNTIGSFRCECRNGFWKVGAGTCRDINECLSRACRSDQRCINTQGGYRCIDDCPKGMQKTSSGVCVDINECSDPTSCAHGMRCENTQGGYSCVCPAGYKATGTRPPCTDLNECLEYTRSPCPHRCVNTIGSFRCICPPGMQYLADEKSCAGLVRLSNTPRYPSATYCPIGFRWTGRRCQDINECQEVRSICQYSCNNTVGSYRCFCPVGYRLAANGRNCEDIDECAEGLMRCLPNQMCFNKRGSVTCLNTPCPPSYVRTRGGYCLKQCFGPDCHLKPKYAIEYKTVALPFGIAAHTDLVRLAVYTSEDKLHRNTTFVARNTFGGPFAIRTQDHKGYVYTTRSLGRSTTYHVEAQATSLAPDGFTVEYKTKFIIYISVAAYRF